MKNKLKRVFPLFISIVMILGCFASRGAIHVSASSLYAVAGNLIEPGDFRLAAVNVPGDPYGRIDVSWDDLTALDQNGDEYAYNYYQRLAGGSQEFELRSTKYGKPIRVLNIYPANTSTATTGDYLQTWLSNTKSYSAPTSADRDRIAASGYGVRTGTGSSLAMRIAANPLGENGQPLITVDKVRQYHFNLDPDSYLKDASGKYKYDVIVTGTADWNGNGAPPGTKINNAAKNAVESFLLAGRGVLFGHDSLITYEAVRNSKSTDSTWKYYPDIWEWGTMMDTDATWGYQRLMKYAGIIPGMTETGGNRTALIEYTATHAKAVNDGFLLTYPWTLALNTVLTIPSTHVNASATKGTIWMILTSTTGVSRGNTQFNYKGEIYNDNYYLMTYNNAAQIQTGHTAGSATADEVAVFANTLYYLSQLTGETSLHDNAALDRAPPAAPEITLDSMDIDGNYDIEMLAEDQGTAYQMYAVGKNQTNTAAPSKKSDTVEQESKTGVKGYLHIISATPGKDPAQTDSVSGKRIPAPVTGASDSSAAGGIAADESFVRTGVSYTQNKDSYLCAAAYDFAGNVGPVTSVKISDLRIGIDVTVVNGSGTPVGNAAVTVNGQSMGITDASGRLSINVRDMGTYTVMASLGGQAPGIAVAVVDNLSPVAGVTITLLATGKGMIWGLVADAETGLPLSEAAVGTVAGQTAVTDAFGYYYITDLVPGGYAMIAGKEGYNSEPAFDVSVTANRSTRQDFSITALGQDDTMLIFGKASNFDTGTAIPAVNIAITGTPAIVTDSFGCYVSRPMRAQTDDFSILASKNGFAGHNGVIRTAANDTEYNFTMTQVDAGYIMVTVLDKETGDPIAGATAFLSGQEQNTGETGAAVFQVPPYGTYYVLAQAAGYNYYASHIEVIVTAPDVYYLTIRMSPGNKGAICGRVMDAITLEGMAGVDVSSVVALDDPISGVKATTDSDGYYVILDVEPGTYNMAARSLPAPNRYNPALDSVAVLSNSGSTMDFTLVKNKSGGGSESPYTIIWGKVTDQASPVQGVAVRDQDSQTNTTDSFGYYVLTGYPHNTEVHLQVDGSGEAVTAKLPDTRHDFEISSALP